MSLAPAVDDAVERDALAGGDADAVAGHDVARSGHSATEPSASIRMALRAESDISLAAAERATSRMR